MLPRCRTHPGALAGWRCRACGALLCPGCAYLARAGTAEVPACARCGGLADLLRVRRAEALPFPPRVLPALGWPLTRSGLLSLAALALVLWPLRSLGALGALLAYGVWWAFLFGVMMATARGQHDLGPPEFSDVLDDLLAPALRGALATAWVWVPAMAWAAFRLGGAAPPAEGELVRDPVLWLLAAAGTAWAPAATLAGAAGGGVLAVLNPLVAFGVISRLGRDYWLAAAAVIALLAADLALVGPLRGLVEGTKVPFLSGWLAAALGTYLPVVAARLLGLLLHVRGDDLGFGAASDYEDAVLDGAVPRGNKPRTTGAPLE